MSTVHPRLITEKFRLFLNENIERNKYITGKKGAKSHLYTFFTIPIAICGGESVVVAGDGALGRGLVIVGRVVGIGCEYGN